MELATTKLFEIPITGTGTSANVTIKGEYRFVTSEIWDATIEIERSNDGGSTFESINVFKSSSDINFDEIFVQLDEAIVRINITAHTSYGMKTPKARLELIDI